MRTNFHPVTGIATVGRKMLLAAITVFVLSASAWAADGGNNVNYWVLNKFNSTYHDAKDVTWVVTAKFAKATFLQDGEKMEVYYSPEAEFIAESRAIPTIDLPRAARKALEKKYKDYTVKEVIEYSTPDRVEFFVSLDSEKSSKILKISPTGSIEVYKSFDK